MPTCAEEWMALQSPEAREHIRAFVDGINAFARTHPELIGDSVRVVLPVTAADVLAHMQRVLYSRFLTGYEQIRGQSRAWSERGSNAWAIAPKRSASGHTLLLQNPHLPWNDLFTWTEAQYTMPGIDVYGAALVFSPVLQIAFNDNLGWTHTVNTQDGADLYELTLAGDGYRWDGGTKAFEPGATSCGSSSRRVSFATTLSELGGRCTSLWWLTNRAPHSRWPRWAFTVDRSRWRSISGGTWGRRRPSTNSSPPYARTRSLVRTSRTAIVPVTS